jgi:hypothetical protein
MIDMERETKKTEIQSYQQPNLPPELFKLIELEATESIESFRWLATQLIQVATVLAIANLTVIGYATANNKAGLLILGAAITTILLIAYAGGMLGAVPLLCRLMAMESTASSMLNRPLETGISLTLLNILGPRFLDDIRGINTLTNPIQKQRAMRKLGRRMLTGLPTRTGTMILILAIVVQLLAVPILVFVFQWRLF